MLPTSRSACAVHIPGWLRHRLEDRKWLHVLKPDVNVAVGVSGGRSSGMLWALAALAAKERGDAPPFGAFQNTGEEDPKTIRFVARLSAHVAPLPMLEYRPPERPGDPPIKSRAVIVTPDTCSMKGEPFDLLLQALADYRREVKGLGPVAPWARMRLCTAYLKIRTQSTYLRDHLGWEDWETWAGLRADEPARVAKLRNQDWRSGGNLGQRAPLATLGITKEDVYRFWKDQPFDLEFTGDDDAILGNCSLCFVKDEADRARASDRDPEKLARWVARQERFGRFTPNGRPTYEQVASEMPTRRQIVTALEDGLDPSDAADRPDVMTRRRFKNLIAQERRRLADGVVRPSCHCEAAGDLDDEDVARA